jgi:hypothetical protein
MLKTAAADARKPRRAPREGLPAVVFAPKPQELPLECLVEEIREASEALRWLPELKRGRARSATGGPPTPLGVRDGDTSPSASEAPKAPEPSSGLRCLVLRGKASEESSRMSLRSRSTHKNVIRVCSPLLCVVLITMALPIAARAWHDDNWRPRHHPYWRGRWGPRYFVPPAIALGVSPGYYAAPAYYPAPVYEAPYSPAPPAYVPAPVPPASQSFEIPSR